VAAAQPKPSQAAFASDAHRRREQSAAHAPGRHIAPALVLLAGVVALGVDRIPVALGWVITIAGGAWLAAGLFRRS
jgi:hypothetical protein